MSESGNITPILKDRIQRERRYLKNKAPPGIPDGALLEQR
jgi:hypothetical protein